MKKIIDKVLTHESFTNKPPVLLDIGASGSLPIHWKILSSHSICIAFDADNRDFEVEESESSIWKKLYTLNRLVLSEPSDSVDFFLTKSPYCSSSLQPNEAALSPWAFKSLFDVEKVIKLSAVDLNSVLKQIGIDYIDWYKTDSQGTDLRIFQSLPNKIIDNMLVADFEPGIIDAYIGEDKLYHLMSCMDKKPFWISDMDIKGSERINLNIKQKLGFFQQKSIGYFLKESPGWCEISYFNKFESQSFSVREFLLAWVFAIIKKQYGFALYIASLGEKNFDHKIFSELQSYSKYRLSLSSPSIIIRILKKIFNQIVIKLFKRSF